MLQFYPTFPLNEQINQTDYYWFDKGFSNVEIRNILRVSKLYEYQEAMIATEEERGEKQEDSIRKSQIKWMPPELDKTEWIYEKLMNLSLKANFDLWKFDLTSIRDAIQYTEYDGNEEGGYDWHMDMGRFPYNHRKISITVQLSDPDDYEGGDLEIWAGGVEPIKAPRQKGAVVIFPSFLMHRITPVTKGVRKSLVLWVGGNTLK
jgi:PKHD-type hydroxylase